MNIEYSNIQIIQIIISRKDLTPAEMKKSTIEKLYAVYEKDPESTEDEERLIRIDHPLPEDSPIISDFEDDDYSA